ncbi:DUF3048 domain-containing protein [Clostridium sp. 'White wine YQ']|uniref:DUF3048 domain-containing protein n=1 Tax=Clostridium sp. 'White wine YQ' TaxID=3027474 RepID=UPI002366C4DA|nr:DUF3048 domain-containing protein [Clostridium sp. 'White wine YQ']MDD7795089.1 DUF3048 domain-containing protein [Clostridium sp. 'White wine YQ']
MIKKFFSLILCSSLILVGCSKHPNTQLDNNTDSSPVSKSEVTQVSSYTGEDTSQEILNNSPFMVIVENSTASRPQSGLNSADIVYETMAEGGIPRFIALFQKNLPKKIGPVRSARAYFISIGKSLNLPFAHCGGSEEALSLISKDKSYMSINEMSNRNFFWRDNERKAPHNLYTSGENIEKYIKSKNLTYTPNKFMTFNNNYWSNPSLQDLNALNLVLNKSYSTSYIYKDGFYEKSMDGKPALDMNTNSILKFKNVVIQKTEISLSKDMVHLNIRLTGTGNAFVLSNGKIINGYWKQENNRTILYDNKNNEIPLSPGNTIGHIVANDVSVN